MVHNSYMTVTKLKSTQIIFNTDCISCNCVERKMMKIGMFVMCLKCYTEKFQTDDPATEERSIYLEWYEIWKERKEHVHCRNKN